MDCATHPWSLYSIVGGRPGEMLRGVGSWTRPPMIALVAAKSASICFPAPADPVLPAVKEPQKALPRYTDGGARAQIDHARTHPDRRHRHRRYGLVRATQMAKAAAQAGDAGPACWHRPRSACHALCPR